jgi:hypothetical protein
MDSGQAACQRLLAELEQAERKAWDSLCRYKFQQFGYWAAVWVHLNRVIGENRPNPFKVVVEQARVLTGFVKVEGRTRRKSAASADDTQF